MNYKTILENNKDNFQLMMAIVLEVNGWDGSLEHLEVQQFDDDFFDTYFEGKPMEAARAWHFGGSDNNWNHEYIRFNGYGNLETLSDYDYQEELKGNADEIIERALELLEKIDLDWAIEQYTDESGDN